MKLSPDGTGITILGSDGVFRSFTGGSPMEPRQVVDAIPFSPALIKAYLDLLPHDQDAENRFNGVDGRNVSKAKWAKPDPDQVPEPLTEKQIEESHQLHEKLRTERGEDWWEKADEKRRSKGWSTVNVRSDHDLGEAARPRGDMS